jgi:peptidoglycan/LPS O-acetylase OafA/YrhL
MAASVLAARADVAAHAVGGLAADVPAVDVQAVDGLEEDLVDSATAREGAVFSLDAGDPPVGRSSFPLMTTTLPTKNLDVLRAIAVLCVLVDHTLTMSGVSHDRWLVELGRVGVLLFFVHTSLVLMASLERQPDGAAKFFVRRAFRIYPLAIVTILAFVALHLPVEGAVTGKRVIANLTLMQNVLGQVDLFGALWSLPLEVQMYIALPACAAIAMRGIRPTLALFLAAVLVGLIVPRQPMLWRLQLAQFGPCFIAGVLAYSMLRLPTRRALPAWSWVPLVLAIVASAVYFRASAGTVERGWLTCLALGVLIPLVWDLSPSRLTRVAHVIATYSYGIYLLHTPALFVSFGWGRAWSAALQWTCYAALLAILPFCAYHLIEKPGIAWGKRITHGRTLVLTPEATPP